MKTYWKALLMLTAVAGLYVPAIAIAQKSAGGVTGEARLHPGTWGNQRSARSAARSQPMYRNTAPVIVQTERAPDAVAQAPTQQRRFSYEPSQQAETSVSCQGSAATESAPAIAQPSTGTYRSFSYEPSMGSSSAPRMNSSRSSNKPLYLLPKTDPRKYRAN